MNIAIGAIMKEEEPYIIEWVAYHRLLGFSLIIADNGGNDRTSNILQSLDELGYITRIEFRHHTTAPQIPAYRAIVRVARRMKIDIIGFLDADEFFTKEFPPSNLDKENGSTYIKSRFQNEKLTQLSFRWICYGSQTDIDDIKKPVIERFQHHANHTRQININVKSFVLLKSLNNLIHNTFYFGPPIFSAHCFEAAQKNWKVGNTKTTKRTLYQIPTEYSSGTIMHYQIKTWGEYQEKIRRGDGAFKHNKNCLEYFNKNDFSDTKTTIPKRTLTALNNEIKSIQEQIENSTIKPKKESIIEKIDRLTLGIGTSKIGGQDKRIFRKILSRL